VITNHDTPNQSLFFLIGASSRNVLWNFATLESSMIITSSTTWVLADVSVYIAAATVRSIANVDPIRADYVIREWNDEEYYSQRSCHEEVNALLKTRRFARKALHQRKSIIVVWTRQLTPPMEAEAK
jgi:hypothetical protein